MESFKRLALAVALAMLPAVAVAGWSQKTTPGGGAVGCEDGTAKLDGNGKVISCTLHDQSDLRGVICVGGKNVTFHSNGRVKSCTMHDVHDFPAVGRCNRGQVLTLTEQGKPLSCH